MQEAQVGVPPARAAPRGSRRWRPKGAPATMRDGAAALRSAFDNALVDAKVEGQSLLRKRDGRWGVQVVSFLSGVLWPWLLFCHVYNLMSGSMRYHSPHLAIGLGPVLSLAACVAVAVWVRGLLRNGLPVRGLLALSFVLFVALVFATVSGDRNYWMYMNSYLTYEDLGSYTNIDPSADKGQSFMDSGQVYFREGSKVVTSDMLAFKSDSTYCVAPIVSQPLWSQGDPNQVQTGGPANMPPSGSVDFWAVGTDCCSTTTKSFNCSAAGDAHARAGLRLLRDDQRPFYLLAVQAWVAQHCPTDDNTAKGRAEAAPLVCLPARHPLFFYWVQDPLLEVNDYHVKSKRLFRMHMFLFLTFDTLLTVGLLYLLTGLGLY